MGKSEIFGHRYGKTKDQGTHSKKAAAALPHFHFHFHVGPPLSPSHLFFFAAPTRTMSITHTIGRLLFSTRISRTGQSNREITSSLSFPLLFLFFNYNICSRQNNSKTKGIRIQSFFFVWWIRTQAYSSSMMELMHVDQHGSQTF